MPALLTRMSTRPKDDSMRLVAASTESTLVTSQEIASALPPSPMIAFAVASSGGRVRPHKRAVAPRLVSERAIAAPMPRPAPVITATCPASGWDSARETVFMGDVLSVSVGAGARFGQTSAIQPALFLHLIQSLEKEARKLLAFGRRGTYNPANRERRVSRLRPQFAPNFAGPSRNRTSIRDKMRSA